MMRSLLGVFLSLFLFAATSLAQSAPCSLSDHTDYSKKIKEFTTESFFSTELVDHLPLSSCVPPPDAALHHIVGAPDVLDYTKDINAYFRLLASKSSRVKVWSIGMSEEGREMLVAAVSDEANLSKLGRYKEITARLADPRGLNVEGHRFAQPEAQHRQRLILPRRQRVKIQHKDPYRRVRYHQRDRACPRRNLP